MCETNPLFLCAQFDVQALLSERLNDKNVNASDESSGDDEKEKVSGIEILKELSTNGVVSGKKRKRVIRVLVRYLHFEHVR